MTTYGGDDRPLEMLDAGSVCTDFASYGPKLGLAGVTAEGFYILMSLIRGKRPAVFFHEITAQRTKGLVDGELRDIYNMIEGVVCPTRGGKPMKRPRRYTFAYDGDRLDFAGSFDEFLEFFSAAVVTNGDCFFVDDNARLIEAFQRAASNGHHMHPSSTHVPLEYQIGSKTYSIYADHMSKREQRQGPDGAYLFDLEQNEKFSPGGPWLPTLVTHGALFSASKEIPGIMLADEHLLAMGEPIPGLLLQRSDYGELPCCIANSVASMAPGKVKELAGNAYDLYAMSCFVFYCLSNISVRASSSTT